MNCPAIVDLNQTIHEELLTALCSKKKVERQIQGLGADETALAIKTLAEDQHGIFTR